jgi:hypothetical protein
MKIHEGLDLAARLRRADDVSVKPRSKEATQKVQASFDRGSTLTSPAAGGGSQVQASGLARCKQALPHGLDGLHGEDLL